MFAPLPGGLLPEASGHIDYRQPLIGWAATWPQWLVTGRLFAACGPSPFAGRPATTTAATDSTAAQAPPAGLVKKPVRESGSGVPEYTRAATRVATAKVLGNLRGALQRPAYFKSLGISAIWQEPGNTLALPPWQAVVLPVR